MRNRKKISMILVVVFGMARFGLKRMPSFPSTVCRPLLRRIFQ
jgi:hypothetical protein